MSDLKENRRLHIAMLRRMTPEQRSQMAMELTGQETEHFKADLQRVFLESPTTKFD